MVFPYLLIGFLVHGFLFYRLYRYVASYNGPRYGAFGKLVVTLVSLLVFGLAFLTIALWPVTLLLWVAYRFDKVPSFLKL